MTPEQIVEMVKQAKVSIRGHYDETGSTPAELQAFAQLVRNAALEDAAQLCDAECDNWDNERPIRLCANLIRIRKS